MSVVLLVGPFVLVSFLMALRGSPEGNTGARSHGNLSGVWEVFQFETKLLSCNGSVIIVECYKIKVWQ